MAQGGACPAPPLHSLDKPHRRIVGATLAVALALAVAFALAIVLALALPLAPIYSAIPAVSSGRACLDHPLSHSDHLPL
jgi:hypothetical protein